MMPQDPAQNIIRDIASRVQVKPTAYGSIRLSLTPELLEAQKFEQKNTVLCSIHAYKQSMQMQCIIYICIQK